MRIASVSARMGSTRLPGKVLRQICGKPHLTRLVNRIWRSKVDGVVVATTQNPEDDAIEYWAKTEGVACYRGSQDDVLSRIVGSQQMMKSDLCVMVWGDCPLIDPFFIDQAIDLVEDGADLAMGPTARRFPHGVSPHALRLELLEELNRTTEDPAHREHTTLAFYEEPGYNVAKLVAPPEWDCNARLQVDYLEDHMVVEAINSFLGPYDDFGTGEIVQLLREQPWIMDINLIRQLSDSAG